jgi:hypothetical protein
MEMTVTFKSLTNIATGENLLKKDMAKLIEVNKDSIELELTAHHSITVGNMVVMDVVVSYGAVRHSVKIMGKVTESTDTRDNTHFILKLIQVNSDVWKKILKLFEEKQGDVTSLFKQVRGR